MADWPRGLALRKHTAHRVEYISSSHSMLVIYAVSVSLEGILLNVEPKKDAWHQLEKSMTVE